MKARLGIFWTVVVLTIAILGFDWREKIRIQQLRNTNDKLALRYTALSREINAIGRTADPPPNSKIQLAATPSPSPVPSKQASGSGRTDAEEPIDPRRVIALNPELRTQYVQLYKDGLDSIYNLLFHALNLPPDQENKLKDLMAQRVANSLQVDQVASDRGLDPDDPAMKKLSGQLNHQNDSDIAALLGPEASGVYKQYIQEQGVAPLIRDLAGNLPTAPLTLDQAEQLSHALSAVSQTNQYGYAVYGTVDLGQAMAKAADILTPEQLPALNAVVRKSLVDLQSKKLTTAR
jgi:hypothetical protein